MDLDEEIIRSEPVSPSSQYLRSSALSLTIIAVMESEIPIDDSMAYTLLNDLFLPINPRFSSLMVDLLSLSPLFSNNLFWTQYHLVTIKNLRYLLIHFLIHFFTIFSLLITFPLYLFYQIY